MSEREINCKFIYKDFNSFNIIYKIYIYNIFLILKINSLFNLKFLTLIN